MTDYEIREVANALMGGGWTGEDEEFFKEENAKQDEENIMSDDDIERVFTEIRRIEAEQAD